MTTERPTPQPAGYFVPYPGHYDAADEISLTELWGRLSAHKPLIALVTFLFGAAALTTSLLLTPIYRAEVLIAPTLERKSPFGGFASQFGGLADLAGISISGGVDVSAAIATLGSRALTEQFIQDKNLMPVLFHRQWDVEKGAWKETDLEEVPTLWHAYRLFDKQIRYIQENRKTGLATLAVEWRDPILAAEWANDLVRRTNARLQRDAISEGEKTIVYLQEQLNRETAVEVQQALYRLIEAETKKVAIAHAREQYAFRVIDPAVPPKKKIKPKRAVIVLVGVFIGLLLSCLWALTRTQVEPQGPNTSPQAT